MKIRIIIFIFISILFLNIPVIVYAEEDDNDVFKYKKLIYNEFALKVGSVIPVTIWQSIETDGNLTKDGKYLFFASDRERGNFDIYLRSMFNITTVRITAHSSKDSNPVVSPDGKHLAFVSQRDDPEGDIFIMKIDPEDIIEKAEKSVSGISALDTAAQNLTTYQEPDSGIVRIKKDASPCWSPDGKNIAFSSTRNGMENIWLMDRNGKNPVQLTTKGGSYPHFSNDGEKIIYISYRDKGGNGNVYIMDIKTKTEIRITDTSDIELSPVFLGNDNEIVYTLINNDSNNDKKIDLKDNSVLYYKNLSKKLDYPLTLNSESSFSPFWSSAYEGIILYSNQVGENINVNIIPDYGIIPRKKNAYSQFDLSEKYIDEYDDPERYLLSLERVYYFFMNERDVDSRIYISRGLTRAAIAYMKLNDMKNASRIKNILSNISEKDLDYSSIMSRYLNNLLDGKQGDKILSDAISDLSQNKKNKLLPFLLEDLGDEFLRLKKNNEAINAYTRIISEYNDFKRIIYIHLKLADISYLFLQNHMSASYLEVLSSDYIYLRLAAAKNILKIFDKEKNNDKKIKISKGMFEKYSDIKNTQDLFLYITGKSYFDKGDLINAKSTLIKALEISRRSGFTNYKINILLGLIFEKEKNYGEMEMYLAEGAKKYAAWYKEPDYKSIIIKLIDYYEVYGERAESGGNYSECVKLYNGYVELVRYLHTRKMFPEIYNEYASRSHILYIDAFSKWKGNDYSELEKLEYEYNKKENKLMQARISFDKAHIYGLAYIYARMAANIMQGTAFKNQLSDGKSDIERLLANSKNSVDQIEWALFMDDTFIDAELLKGWIYQYVDLKRNESKKSGAGNSDLFNKYFPESLWEKNISNYEKALEINDESQYPEREGNLNLNIANTYFLLKNYPRAFSHYIEVKKYKKYFSSRIQEALFYYHLGYCYWQNDDLERSREEMQKAMIIYNSLSSGNYTKYKYQFYNLYRFFALFDRMEKKYNKAITWYNRIIDLSKRYNINIDKARYIQEIAFCYKELGNVKSALAYLGMADMILKDYKITEKDYSLRFTVFGIFEFGLLDLGQDTYVIGSNRIDEELDTVQKRLLNASLEYEIYYENGEIVNAINSLKKKLDIIGDRESRIYYEARVIALNNIGFCFFKLRDYEKAEYYFKLAWDFAAKEADDLEGLFITIQNSANLYSYLLENNINSLAEPEMKIDSFIRQIDDYRDQYEQKKYEKEVKKLKETARAQRGEIQESEIARIRETIAEEAKRKYYSLDIVIGIFEYQKAELLRKRLIEEDDETEDQNNKAGKGFDYYKYNEVIFQLYSKAIKRFESAIKIAENKESKRLFVKLLLDLGKCQERIGLADDSYNSYLSAVNDASKYEYHDLLWMAYHGTAELLKDHGKEIEGDGYLALALEYYNNAVKIIEESPYLYSGEMNRVMSVYNSYVILLAGSNKPEKALGISERGYEVRRLMLVGFSSPEFYSAEDSGDYREYVKQIKEIEKIKNEISVLLESGDSEESFALKEKLKHKTSALKVFINNIKKNRPFFASFISLANEGLRKYNNAVIYKFISSGKNVFAWKFDSGKLLFSKLASADGQNSFADMIADFMQDGYKDKYRFIVLNETAVRIFRNNRYNKKTIPPFMYIPSIERAGYYTSANNITISNILYNGQGLQKKLSKTEDSGNIKIVEGNFIDNDIADFSILIDGKNELSSSVFFKRRLEPALVIKNFDNLELETLLLIIESSLYSGVRTVYFYKADMSPEGIADLISGININSFDEIALGDDNFYRIGFKGYSPEYRKKIINDFLSEELKNYTKYLNLGEHERAELYLKKWHKQNPSEKDNAIYLYNMAEIQFLNGNSQRSISYLNRLIDSPKDPGEINLKALSKKIYLLLYNSNFTEAAEILKQTDRNNNFKTSADYFVYTSILNLVKSDNNTTLNDLEDIKNLSSILPNNKLKLLFAEYLNLFEKPRLANAVLENWTRDYNTTERDLLKYALLKGNVNKNYFFSQRSKDILSIDINENIKNEVLFLSIIDGRYDRISVFPVYFTLNKLINNLRYDLALNLIPEFDIREIVSKSLMLDSVQLLKSIVKIYEAEEQYEDALKTIKEMNVLLREMKLSLLLKDSVYKESAYLSKLQKHNESYNTALAGLALLKRNDDLYFKYQLLLIEEGLYLGKIEDAVARINDIEPGIKKNEYKYVLYFLKARIELLKIFINKKVPDSQWAKIEKLILSGLDTIDTSPYIISKFNRIDLINEGLDFLISYKMSRNDASGSLLYAEVKKQINLRSKYPGLVSRYVLPEDVINRFKAIKNQNQNSEFTELLNKYPSLQVNALANYIPLELFRNKIKNNSVVLYIVKNVNDILCWIILNNSIKTLRIKDGFLKIDNILNKYDNISAINNISQVSKELYDVFNPLEKYYKEKENIIFIADNNLERIPFEIIGSGNMLEEAYNIMYIPSILSSFMDRRPVKNSVHFVDTINQSIINKLEFVSVRESGIHFNYSADKSGIAHINSKILFDSLNGEIYIKGKIYRDLIESDFVYIPDYDLRNITINDFAVINSFHGVRGALINNAAIHDLNNAQFVDIFYRDFNNTKNLQNSFQLAKESLRKNRRFSSPAYWAGIRLYFNGM